MGEGGGGEGGVGDGGSEGKGGTRRQTGSVCYTTAGDK